MSFFEYHNKHLSYLTIPTWHELYAWYEVNVEKCDEMWIAISRSWPPKKGVISYVDAVEVALCFGWIDSTNVSYDGMHLSRFSPRRSKSLWTELNKARCRRLIRLGYMTEYGKDVLPDLDKNKLQISEWLFNKTYNNDEVKSKLQALPSLYVRIRLYNINFMFDKKHDIDAAQRQLDKFIDFAMKGQTYGMWNDYGRLDNDE